MISTPREKPAPTKVEYAHEELLPEVLRGKVRNRLFDLTQYCLEKAWPLLIYVLPVCIVLCAVMFATRHEGLAALSLIGFVFWIVWQRWKELNDLFVGENRRINRRLRKEVASRPRSLVAPHDLATLYVMQVSQEAFNAVSWVAPENALLLQVDTAGNRLLLEGDSSSCCIPIGALFAVEVICMAHRVCEHEQMWILHLVVHFEDELREMWLYPVKPGWFPVSNATRRKRAEELCRQIQALRRP